MRPTLLAWSCLGGRSPAVFRIEAPVDEPTAVISPAQAWEAVEAGWRQPETLLVPAPDSFRLKQAVATTGIPPRYSRSSSHHICEE
jgi:hypothetical protein